MKTKQLSNATFDATLSNIKTPILVDFWAPWCGPCRTLGPIIDQIADEQDDQSTVAKVNIDDSPELAARYGIRSIPTLIVFKDGEPVTILNGVRGKQEIEQAISSAA